MTTNEISKQTKRKLRELNEKAWEAELMAELNSLALDFDRWKRGEIDSFELNDRVRRFTRGPSRELWSYYADCNIQGVRIRVGSAVYRGIIDRADVPEDVLALIEPVFAVLSEHSSESR